MSLLPEIVDGELVIEEERFETERERAIRLKKFIIKPRKKRRAIESGDENMGELNNMGHNEVSEDFEDSPFADRQPIENEDED